MIMRHQVSIDISQKERQEEILSFFQKAKENVIFSQEPTYIHGYFLVEDMEFIEIKFQLFPCYIGTQKDESGCIYAKYMVDQSSVI